MPMVRAMRLLNAIEAGTTSGAQLQTLLQDPGRYGEWQQMQEMRGQVRRMAASSTAMDAIAASSTAMDAVIASSTAMDAVIASSTAMDAVAASSTAKMAIFNSDTALAAVAGSSAALAAMRASPQYSVQTSLISGSSRPIPGTVNGASYILVGVSAAGGAQSYQITTLSTRRSGSARPLSAAPGGTAGTNAQTVTLCTPLGAPFTFSHSGGSSSSHAWYFGLLRCDV